MGINQPRALAYKLKGSVLDKRDGMRVAAADEFFLFYGDGGGRIVYFIGIERQFVMGMGEGGQACVGAFADKKAAFARQGDGAGQQRGGVDGCRAQKNIPVVFAEFEVDIFAFIANARITVVDGNGAGAGGVDMQKSLHGFTICLDMG